MVEGMTDGSFIGWEKKSVVVLNVTDDPGGARTKRLLKDNEAQVSGRSLRSAVIYLCLSTRLCYKFSSTLFSTLVKKPLFFQASLYAT